MDDDIFSSHFSLQFVALPLILHLTKHLSLNPLLNSDMEKYPELKWSNPFLFLAYYLYISELQKCSIPIPLWY